jgi:hypothetical protein
MLSRERRLILQKKALAQQGKQSRAKKGAAKDDYDVFKLIDAPDEDHPAGTGPSSDAMRSASRKRPGKRPDAGVHPMV